MNRKEYAHKTISVIAMKLECKAHTWTSNNGKCV
jgi:hypothetical protein